MRKKAFYIISKLILCSMLLYYFSPAQVPADCYKTFKARGATYKSQRNYTAARQQYQTAKNCNNLTNQQRREIDSLIADINRRR